MREGCWDQAQPFSVDGVFAAFRHLSARGPTPFSSVLRRALFHGRRPPRRRRLARAMAEGPDLDLSISELPALQPEALQGYAAAQDAARSAAPPAVAARAPVLSIRRMKADISRAGLSRRGCWTREEVEARHRQAVARLEGREEPETSASREGDELDVSRQGATRDFLARVAAGEGCEWEMTFFVSLSREFGDEWLENKIAGDDGVPLPGPLVALGRAYKAKFEDPPGGSHDRLILKLKRRHCSYCHQVSGPSGPSLPHCSAPERNTRRRSRAQNAAVAGLGRRRRRRRVRAGPRRTRRRPKLRGPGRGGAAGCHVDIPRGWAVQARGEPRGARRAKRRAASREAREADL